MQFIARVFAQVFLENVIRDAVTYTEQQEEDRNCHGRGVRPEEAGQDFERLRRIVS